MHGLAADASLPVVERIGGDAGAEPAGHVHAVSANRGSVRSLGEGSAREAQRAVGSRTPCRHSIKDNVNMFVDEALRKSYQNESEMRAALRKVEDIKQRMQLLCGNP